ncbi:MAG: iron-sulfur cluster assembly protein [Conexivisphaerales archaeon]
MISVSPSREMAERVLEALKVVYDPEIPFNIVDLGLIYELNINEKGEVKVKMTVTSPGCPVGPWLLDEVRNACLSVPGITKVDVELVFDPPWTPEMMSEGAHKMLGI